MWDAWDTDLARYPANKKKMTGTGYISEFLIRLDTRYPAGFSVQTLSDFKYWYL
jgi:hypothetical protein